MKKEDEATGDITIIQKKMPLSEIWRNKIIIPVDHN